MEAAPGPLVVALSLRLDAPRERVFSMVTDPTTLTRWWGPAGFTTPEIEFNPRVGAGYRLGMQPPGAELFHLAGEFLEVDPPRRLVFTFRWEEPDPDDRETVVRLWLDSVGDATDVRLWQGEFATQARLALHAGGWRDSFEKLRALAEA